MLRVSSSGYSMRRGKWPLSRPGGRRDRAESVRGPQDRHVVGGEGRVGREDRQALELGLGDQQAVEGIGMAGCRQGAHLPGMLGTDRQQLETELLDSRRQIIGGIELAESALD